MILLATNYWPYAAVVAILLAVVLLLRMLTQSKRLPYVKRDCLITKSELKFYRSLQQAVAGDWEIFAMVRIADLVRVEKGVKKYRSWLNKILSKHIDFVICDSATLVPLVAIELDDKSHERPDRIARDELVNDIFDSADFPLLRIPVRSTYDVKAIRQEIEQNL